MDPRCAPVWAPAGPAPGQPLGLGALYASLNPPLSCHSYAAVQSYCMCSAGPLLEHGPNGVHSWPCVTCGVLLEASSAFCTLLAQMAALYSCFLMIHKLQPTSKAKPCQGQGGSDRLIVVFYVFEMVNAPS